MTTGAASGQALREHPSRGHDSAVVLVAASACLVWYLAVAAVCSIGFAQLYEKHVPRPTGDAD